jgi:hypothetical protein
LRKLKFAEAKDAPPIAIELFDTPEDAASVQTTDISIHGKAGIAWLCRQHVLEGDLDAAAGKHVLYLNSRAESETPERTEAKQFLQKQLKIRQFTTPQLLSPSGIRR